MWNGTMFVDLDWPLNASSLLSASAELLVNITQKDIHAVYCTVLQRARWYRYICAPLLGITGLDRGISILNVITVESHKLKCTSEVVFKFGDELFQLGPSFNQRLEFGYDFACTHKGIHLCFVMSPDKMIFNELIKLYYANRWWSH